MSLAHSPGEIRVRQAGMVRLSALMFFQLFVFGSFGPILSLYLQDTLRFSPGQTGFIMAMSVVSSVIAPILSVYVVDRLVRAKWLFILCHAALAATAAGMSASRSFDSFLVLYLLNAMCTGPSMGMLNAIAFQRLHDLDGNARNFGAIRVWGTLGWMGAGYLVTGLWAALPVLFPAVPAAGFQPWAFLVAAAGSAACIALSVSLPGDKPTMPEKREFIPRAALEVFRRGGVVALFVVYLISSIIDKLYAFGAAPYLARLGFREAWIPSILTLGQVTEVFMLFGLGSLLSRFSYKPVLALGAGAQALRFLLLWSGVPALGLAGVSLNGIVFACLYSAILMYIDQRSDARSRQAMHQLVQLFIGGASALLGNALAGLLGHLARAEGGTGYRGYWLFPLGGALVSLALVWLLFREDRQRAVGGAKVRL
jgi:MFS family permease